MANYYRSWTCADLDVTLYSSDVINNPDWYSSNPVDVCPLAKCVGYEILNHFDSYIQESFQTGVVWTSSIIMIANYYSNGVLQNRGPCIRFATYFSGSVGYLRVTVGYGNHDGISGTRVKDFTKDQYEAFPIYARKIYIIRNMLRSSYADQGAPNYNGQYEYTIWFGGVQLRTGTWDSTYNQMRYTAIPGVGDPAACLLSVPCSQSTKRDQSEGVYEINSDYSSYVSLGKGETGANLTDSSGGYDPDPPDPTDVDPNAVGPGYPSGPGGGGGDHDPDSDPISVPSVPTIGVQSLGGVTMYKLTSAEMGTFGRELVSKNLWDAVKLYFDNPFDYIVGISLLPVTPPGSEMWYPRIGLFPFQYAYPIVSEQFVEVDCGTLDITEYWGSCFDYEPYCQITIWLPYIGYRALPVDEVMGRTLYVKYHIDVLTGDCVAFLGVTASADDVTKVIAQYSGNCAVQMPYTSVTFDGMISAGLQMCAGAGVFAGTEGNGGADTLGNATISMISGMKGEVQQGGVLGSTNGYMSIQKPYIIKRIRHQSLPTNYREMRGYPSNVNATLSQLETGYAEVEDIQLNNIPAMEEERKEIIELLKGGVLL